MGKAVAVLGIWACVFGLSAVHNDGLLTFIALVLAVCATDIVANMKG